MRRFDTAVCFRISIRCRYQFCIPDYKLKVTGHTNNIPIKNNDVNSLFTIVTNGGEGG